MLWKNIHLSHDPPPEQYNLKMNLEFFTGNEMLMLLYLFIRLKGDEARLSVAGKAF